MAESAEPVEVGKPEVQAEPQQQDQNHEEKPGQSEEEQGQSDDSIKENQTEETSESDGSSDSQSKDPPKEQQTEQLEENEQESGVEQDLEEQPVEQVPDEQFNKEEVQAKHLEVSQDSILLPTEHTERAIEDEEMPSMLTICSSQIDESEVDYKQEEEKKPALVEKNSPKFSSTKVEEDDSDECVVIDDDDDEDVDEKREEEEYSYDEDEDDDEGESEESDYEDEEEGRNQYNENYVKRNVRLVRRTGNKDEEEYDDDMEDFEDREDDDDEDEEEEYEDQEDDDSDGDRFDGGSDDLVIRHSNGLSKITKERSSSLQELSYSKEQSAKNRRSYNPFSQKARFERSQIERRVGGNQYDYVPSKTKKYIGELEEQRRLSTEKRKKAQDEARLRNQEMIESQLRRSEEVVIACRRMKNYTEKTLKEVAEETEQVLHMPQGFENGEVSIFQRHSADNGRQVVDREEMDVDPIAIQDQRYSNKNEKFNGGAVSDNQNAYASERKGIHRREEYSLKPVLNGEDQNYVSNYRTLCYEEYMKGSSNNENSENIKEIQSIPEKCNNNVSEAPCILEIENDTSNFCPTSEKTSEEDFHNRKTPIAMNQQSSFYQESEINSLRLQLEQRNSQFDHLRDAYQKTMSENVTMRMELENLKKAVAYYQEQQQKVILEKKATAVQTESSRGPVLNMPDIDIDNDMPVDPRAATVSMVSAASSHWSDGTESAVVSMEAPPSVTTVLNSDESVNTQAKTPKQKNALSRAFLTSSKILQTLSNLTGGKSKGDKQKRSKQAVPEIVIDKAPLGKADTVAPSNSRKRKASDDMEGSTQPTKIPHTSKTERNKGDQTQAASDSEFVADSNDKDNLNNAGASAANDNDDEGEVFNLNDEDVKVFVYSEDEQTKEHSFLIQAKEVSSNPNRGARECGPYLLGNVEVYMTEMNGTINIWGKELSQASVSQNADELETSTKSKNPKSDFHWQSTPRVFSNNASASTGKKSRILPRFSQAEKYNACAASNNAERDHCNLHRGSWSSCTRNVHNDHQSCCQRARVEEDYGCRHKVDCRASGIPPGCRSHVLDAGRFSLPNVYQEASCCCNPRANYCRHSGYEEPHRHRPFVRRHSFNPSDDELESEEDNILQQASKFVQSAKQNSSHSSSNEKPAPQTRQSGSADSIGENENDPLIAQRPHVDEPEARKRRLSGKRVRGLLLDLLKGNCGDCKATDSVINPNLRQNASVYEPSVPVQKAVLCSPSQPTCSLRSNDKCSSCRLRPDKTAGLETQMEFILTEMDRLNSCSATLREMIETLRKDDTKNN